MPPGGVFVDIAASSLRTCGVREGGELVCWGREWRSLGGPEVLPSGRFVKVSLGAGHGCAIAADGSLACWLDGRLEDRDLLARSSWVQVPEGSFVDVSAPALCAVRDSGELACWGRGSGWSGPPGGRFSEMVDDMAARRLCALSVGGELVCWGGEVGLDRERYRVPMGRFADMDMAGGFGCAVRAEGPVVCWPLWSGSDVEWPFDLSGVRAGAFSSVQVLRGAVCALEAGGGIECWGYGEAAESGSRPGSFVQFDASDEGYCAVDAAGRVGCWGAVGESGEWGRREAPEGRFSQVSVAGGHGCGVRVDTTLECWPPRPDFGDPYRWTMSLLPAEAGFVSVRIGFGSVCAVRVDSTVWCWQLSDEDQAVADAGGFVDAWPAEDGFCGLRSDGTAFCSADQWPRELPERELAEFFPGHECGLAPDGRLDCWGYNPVQSILRPPPEGVGPLVSAAVDGSRACGVNAGGRLVCWFTNEHGVAEPYDLVEWLASYYGVDYDPLEPGEPRLGVFVGVGSLSHNDGWCVLDAGGEVECRWESYPVGGLEAPSELPPTGPFVDVAVGGRHACGIRTDGTVACWGEDSDWVDQDWVPVVE